MHTYLKLTKAFITFFCIFSLLACSKKTDPAQNITLSNAIDAAKEISQKTKNENDSAVITDSLNDYQSANESEIIKSYSNLFSRAGKTLIVKNKIGKAKSYTNEFDAETPATTDEAATYNIIRYWPEHSIVGIHKSSCSGECSNVLLIDLNTDFKDFSISGFPSITKDGTHIASFNVDIFAGFLFNGITLYKRSASHEFVEEYTSDDGEWGVKAVQWESNHQINIFTQFQCKDSSEQKICDEKRSLTFVNDKWILK